MKLFRKMQQDWKWFTINAIGLSAAMACMLIIFPYARKELSYDRFHAKANQIYRVTSEESDGATALHPARVYGDWPKKLMTDYPAIEKMVRLVPFRKAIIKIGNQKFNSQCAYSTDSSFFDVFNFKVLSGNPGKAFSQPGRAFISRSLAMKYFGNINVVGKEISLLGPQQSKPNVYIIDGVMEDFPANSHFHAELLFSFTGEEEQTAWAYTYFLMKKGTDVDALRNTIQQKWEKEKEPNSRASVLYLQKLTDIHLRSHKTREMEPNGDIRSIYMLLIGALIILCIALINFFNLSRVQFIAGMKSIQVKLINGASKWHLAKEMIFGSVLLSTVSILAGFIFAWETSKYLGIKLFSLGSIDTIIVIVISMTVMIAALSVLPLFTTGIKPGILLKRKTKNLYTLPLIFQFILAVVAICGALVLNRQMYFLNNEHPCANNTSMIVIPWNTWEAVQRYEAFKQELRSHPSVKNMTAAMEEPGGNILDGCLFTMEGIAKSQAKALNILTTDSNFFDMMGITPLAGTTRLGYTPSQQWEADAVELSMLRDNKETDPAKINALEKKLGNYREKYILNQSALKVLGISNPKDAIGKKFRLNFYLPDVFPEGEIIGVVPDFHYTDLHNAEKPLAIAPRKMFNFNFIIEIDQQQRSEAIAAIHDAWKKINPDLPLNYEYISDTYQKVYVNEIAQTRALSLFALIAVLLSALGMFALASFNMQRRVKEIGIRKINGAKIWEVLFMLNKDLVKWVAIAFVIAMPAAYYAVHRWLENFAYKTELSWWIFALSGLLALGIALLTVSWQSWRAATRNPVEALRYE